VKPGDPHRREDGRILASPPIKTGVFRASEAPATSRGAEARGVARARSAFLAGPVDLEPLRSTNQ